MLAIILTVFIYNQIIAILLAAFLLTIYLLSYLSSLSFKKKIIRSIKGYSLLNDNELANKMKLPVDKIRDTLFSLSKNQKRKKWLIVFLNKRYIFYNEATIDRFKELYSMGFNEKEILENLRKNIKIKTRAEIKAIEDTLMNQKRLDN